MAQDNLCSAFTSSDWIAISSVVIALCALGVSFWQGWVAREYSRLSSRPLLEIECNAFVNAGILIKNCGHGPAIVKSISVTSNNEEFQLCGRKDYQRFVNHILPESAQALINTSIPEKDSAIAASEERFLLRIQTVEGDNTIGKHLDTLFKAFLVVVKYESLYKETFTIRYEQY